MSASLPNGEMDFWECGFPFIGIKLNRNNPGSMQFWELGFPSNYQFPPPYSSQIKTINGELLTNIATKNGVSLSDIKVINKINNS